MSSAPVPPPPGARPSEDVDESGAAAVLALAALLRGRSIAVLTGAGCSTESGIPDYRGPGRSGPPRNPILHDAFLRRSEVRQRYWARATLGWMRFSAARPNAAHAALAALETAGAINGVITQNVDRLHHRAGSRRVVELHGALEEVRCLGCDAVHARSDVHERLCAANRMWLARRQAAALAPDGDTPLDPADEASFVVLGCAACGGVLKPAVVFFGGTVIEPVVKDASDLVDAAGALLVVGSSLEVYSGYRFVRRAAERGLPIAIVNQGPTRADPLATAKVEARAGWVLPALLTHLLA